MIRTLLLALLILAPPGAFAADAPELPEQNLLMMKNDSPLIAFRILIKTGSAMDPKGKEGVASLTASLLSDGSTKNNGIEKILELLFPMAATYTAQVDKEMTVFMGVTHKDYLMPYYALLRDAILSPAFKQDDFDRIKKDQLNNVTRTLRYNNDEELGKEVLSQAIYANHPCGHPENGLGGTVANLTLQDVKDFYAGQYTQKNLWIGVAGDFTDELIRQIRKDFAALPEGRDAAFKLPAPEPIREMKAVLVEKETAATAISFGFPIPFTRADPDYYSMLIMNTWLGKHRNSFSHLYQVMRSARGLNYGDYSYIEHFPLAGSRIQPPPNVGRRQQMFQVWIRPVQNPNRHFALRQALREVRMLMDNGMTKADFELSRNFVLNNTVNLALSNSEQLGYALDDRFYGLKEPFLEQVKTRLPALKLEDVNAAIKKYMTAQNLIVAAVTQDAAAFKTALVGNTPSPIRYDSEKPQALLDEDKVIAAYPLGLKADSVSIVPVEKVFQ